MNHGAAVEEAESRRHLPAARNLAQPATARSPGSFRHVERSPKRTDRLRIVGHRQRHTRLLSQKPLHTGAARNSTGKDEPLSHAKAQRSFISNRARKTPPIAVVR